MGFDIMKTHHFLERFKSAVRENRRADVAKLITYPIRAPASDGGSLVRTRAELLKNYDRIFTDLLRRALENASVCTVSLIRQSVVVGNGSIWFMAPEGESIQVVTITPPSLPEFVESGGGCTGDALLDGGVCPPECKPWDER